MVFLASCSQPSKDKEFISIVSSFNKPKNPKGIPPLSMPVYAPFNFILDTGGRVYYYQLQLGKPKCASGNDDYLTPPFIRLLPENIVQVSQSNIEDFIKDNIQFLDKDYKYVSISSSLDTVKSSPLKKLIDIFRDTTYGATYLIRRTTQEEQIVLDYKKRQIYYDPNSVVWDSSRINFPIKMITPKIQSEE